MPSLREKKRYLVFEIITEGQIGDFKSVSSAINGTALDLLGELGVGDSGLWLLNDQWKPETKKGVIKVNNKHVEKLKMSLSLIQNINDTRVIVKSVGVSGTLKQAKEKFLAS